MSAEARRQDLILPLSAPYRADGPTLSVGLQAADPGRLKAALLAYEGHFPRRPLWEGPPHSYAGPCDLTLDLTTGAVRLANQEWGRVPMPLPGRRFCWQLTLEGANGSRRTRMTGHYLPVEGRGVSAAYFQGDDYVDHEAQSAGDHQQVLQLLRQHHACDPVIEIGCATGGLLAALDAAGFQAIGLDISEWAVARARQRLGPDRVWLCDVERDPLPSGATVHGPFGVILLLSVLEHFRDPFGVLAKLTPLAAPGSLLLLHTTNADSLSHILFGRQWEGYFDWTHLGVDRVSVRRLREELPQLGWRCERLVTHRVWDGDADPTRATLREWWAADARFRQLLAERDLGDLITCVAIKD